MTTSAFDPASRVRFIQFIPHLQRAGWNVEHRPNRPDRQWSSSLPGRFSRMVHHRLARGLMLANRLRDVDEAARYDVVFVNRDLAGNGLFFEKRLLRRNPRVIFDFDDAIFIGKSDYAVRWMCENAACVTVGNEYLAAWARRLTENVTVVPTVIDTDQYEIAPASRHESECVRIGWSGSDQSIRYTLFPYLPMLREAQRLVPFELVIVTNTRPVLPVEGLKWSFVPWSVEGEKHLASAFEIGIMPLQDDEFQRGKCGLKLLQYMAAGLPTIASHVGVNAEITIPGVTGLLARTKSDWLEAILQLAASPERRFSMGKAGRLRCEQAYSIRRWIGPLTKILESVASHRIREAEVAAAWEN